MKPRAAQTREDYTRLITVYIKRRNKLREQFGKTWRSDPGYVQRSRKINKRLTIWRRAIKRIDEIRAILHRINHRIKTVYGISVYLSVSNWQKLSNNRRESYFIRKLFCKYAIEQGISGNYVSNFVGWKDRTQASRCRLEVNHLIKTDVQFNNQWQTFKKAIRRQVPQQIQEL